MLKQPLFRLGLIILAASLALVFIPFYDRNEPFAFVNLILFGIGFVTMFAGVIKADRNAAKAEGRKPDF